MKKTLLLLAAALALGALSDVRAQEFDASASREIFDFSPFTDSGILNLFYNAQQAGREYPTREEFEAAGFNMTDLEFARSHVRPRPIIYEQEKQLVSSVKNTRRLWMNIPMGTAKGIGGYPGTNAGDDTYSIWNYTHLFGAWNHGLFQAPGCWVDAAHQNGTDIFCGIKFFESWTAGSGDAAYSKLITEKNGDGTFKYVKPLISALQFFGTDGINYNWEDASYSNEEIVAFHKALYKEAEARGFTNFHIGLYTSMSTLTANNANALFGNSEGRTAETFLNYSGNDFISAMAMRSSETAANNAMGTTDGLYAGAWIVTMNRSWTNLAGRDIGAVLWGEHASSRFWSNNVGNDAKEFQANYQSLLERAVSGGNRNPAQRPAMQKTGNEWGWSGTTPPLSKFGGLATYFPERSAIQGRLPFHTYFNTGIGEVYTYKGKRTHGGWYNMSTQDIVPTYRWLVYKAGTTTVSSIVNPEFTIEDAYMGGSCLRLKGTGTGDADIVLFRTKLTGTAGQPYAKIAVKTKKDGTAETGLSVIVKVGEQWKEYPVGATAGPAWEEKTVELSGISAADEIDFIGLRTKGVTADYQVFVGELQINDEATAKPAAVKDLMAEVRRETTTKLSVKLNWTLDANGASPYGLVYNDEGAVDHFEVLYKNGENGRVSVVSHVQSWSAFVGDMPMATDEQPIFGVRAVGTDLKSYSEPVWVQVVRSTNVPQGADADGLEYGVSEINPDAEGYKTAITTRFLTKITTTGASVANLSYACSQPGPEADLNYVDATQTAVLKVKQGDEIQLSYEWLNSGDGIQWCIMKSYADWNINGFFEGSTDELLTEQGTPNTNNSYENTREGSVTGSPLHVNGWSSSPLVPFTLKVPQDAVRGKSRIRIVFTDAWQPHPGPVGLTAKGFTIDLGLEISGENEERKPTVSPVDEGEADEPEGLTASEPDAVLAQRAASELTVKDGCLQFANVEKAWIYTTDGRLVRFVKNPTAVGTDFPAGAYIVKMQDHNVIRTRKITLR